MKLLFVCLGNICRSPLAEGVFNHLAALAGRSGEFVADSAGTGAWHLGEAADPRSRKVAQDHGFRLTHRARQVRPSDFTDFDLILAMDNDNLAHLQNLASRYPATAEIRLLRDFDPDPGDRQVPDPYYGGPEGFENVLEMCRRSCSVLLETFSKKP